MSQSLLEMIPPGLAGRFRSAVARWTDTPEEGGWDLAPAYGAFVDDAGFVVSGSRPPRALLGSDDPRHLELDPGLESSLEVGTTVVFLDWGRQSLSWEEIFELWDAWDSQGMVAGCGAVGVPWSLAHRWTAPGWVAFRDGFDGAPLATQVRVLPAEEDRGAGPEDASAGAPESFLAKARRLRGEEPAPAAEAESLPMLPFTLAALQNPGHLWPQGVA